MFQYLLGLINQDRQNNGLNPVVLNYNAAPQNHAQDMFNNYFLSHWGTDGLKPYMRYTQEGGLNYEQENSAYSGWFNRADNPNSYTNLNVKQEIKSLEDAMMAETPPNDGHRRAILNQWSKKVNLGLVYDNKRLAMVEEFEGDYIEYTQPPTLSGNILSLSGQIKLDNIDLNNITIAFDPLPQPLTADQLNYSMPNTYSLGKSVNFILPPPPPGQYYSSLSSQAILASKWDLSQTGQFSIQVDISPALANGSGVYTFAMIVKLGNEPKNVTNYSIWVK